MKRGLWFIAVVAGACSRPETNAVVATGTLEIIEVDVAPLLTARVDRVLVEDGDSVKAGDTLVILRQPSSTSEIEQRSANVSASRAGLAEVQRGSRAPAIARAQAEVRALDAEAVRMGNDARRAARLFEVGAIGRQQLEAIVTASREAALRREAARQTLLLLQQGSTREQVAGARAQVEGAEASLSAMEASVRALTLLAPSSGVVLSRNVEPGEVVSAGQSAVTLGESRRPWVRVYVNALDLPKVKVGSVARATIDGLPGREFTGRVVAINTKAEFTPRVALTENERADMTFGVKIEFDESSGVLKPGLPVTVSIPAASGR